VAANWAPWQTVATWYMWRSIDPIPVEYWSNIPWILEFLKD
jgi:hypothetical protein